MYAVDLLILRALSEAPLHGYAITRWIRNASHDALTIEEGSLYPALQRMLKEGWVDAKWGVSASKRRVRIYRLTSAGAKHLEREVSSFERMLEGIRRVLSPAER